MKKKLLSLALALVLCLSLAVPAFAAEEKKDAAPASTEEKKDEAPAEGEEKKDESKTPAEGEEKKDESKTPAEGEEKKDESKDPAEGEEKKDESKAPAGEEKKDESKAPAEDKKDEAPAAPKFTDVAPTSAFAAAIDWAVEQKITTGKTETTFGPSDTCTVSHILTFLWRANGKPGAKEGVKDRDAALAWFESEIVDKHGEPDAACTRSMAVLYMWQAAGSPEVETDKTFTDVAADAAFAPAVAWAVENGVTSGTGDGTTFSPDNTCTRGQIVTFLYRAANAAAAPAEGEASK